MCAGECLLSADLITILNGPASGSPGAVESRQETMKQIFLKACPHFDKSWNFARCLLPPPSLAHISLFIWSALCTITQWLIVQSCPADWERVRLCGETLKAQAVTRNSLRTSVLCAA